MKLAPKFLDGAVLAVNALPGVCAVFDAPRCELERAWIFDSTHDWYGRVSGTGTYARDRRVFAPLWKNRTLITGTEDVLRELVHFVADRHPRIPILLYPSFLSLLVNADLQGITSSLASQIENPILCVQRESLEDDWVDGIRRTQEAVFSFLTTEQGRTQPHVAGFCAFRSEGDETGNLMEIERLWRMADLPQALWPFSGRHFDFTPISVASPRIAFPLGCPQDDSSRQVQTVRVDLPIGVEHTCAFLRTLGQFFDRPDQVERVIDQERRILRERLAPLVANSLAGKAAVVVADPWNARGLAAALREMNLEVSLAVVLRRSGCDERDLQLLRAHTADLLVDPDYQSTEERIKELASLGLLDVVVGSAVLRDAACRASLPYVEVTAPHFLEHFAAPNPYMGFEGLARLAERISNALLRPRPLRCI